jgi:hypothetical protein
MTAKMGAEETLTRMTAEMAWITCPDIKRLGYRFPEQFKVGSKELLRRVAGNRTTSAWKGSDGSGD